MKNPLLSIMVLVVTSSFSSAFGAPPSFTTLQTGQSREVNQDLLINIVFVGYEQGAGQRDINEAVFRGFLPSTYRSIVRAKRYYGFDAHNGVNFNYQYNVVYADQAFEDAYFNYLTSIAAPAPINYYQNLYNQQSIRSQTIGQNYEINATAAEKWLGENAPAMIGVDTTKYTVFFVNWFGRSDFNFHMYVEPGEPDVDTDFNFALQDIRKIIAWGGTTENDPETPLGSLRRVWFHDLSAGPEFGTGNWNLADADIDGDGRFDYRMPPVWEYGNVNGYRLFTDLSWDLGMITRFVAINLLFTASPIYEPALSPPKLPKNIQLDINLYQVDPSLDARSILNEAYVVGKLARLQPYNVFSSDTRNAPYQGNAERVFNCFAAFDPCYGGRPFSNFFFGDLFLFHVDHLNQYLEGEEDYEIPIFIYTTPHRYDFAFAGGVADDNWVDGTQSFIYLHQPRWLTDLGFGLSSTVTHEAGHHVSLSHPHDGYDSELDIQYSAFDSRFVWAGDESASVMGYLGNNADFSQFDRDNIDRTMVLTFINHANGILAKVLTSPRADQVTNLLTAADQKATTALLQYQNMNYVSAAFDAQDAYQKVIEAAQQIRIPVEPQAWTADYRAKGQTFMFVDDFNHFRRPNAK